MIFGGFQKLTLLDFPGVVACTLFTKGCNFLCPFCHNAPLVTRPKEAESFSQEEILAFLKKRQGVLEGVCVTGGEPLLHADLPAFLRQVKDLGYKIKLDTNGSFPKRLKDLAAEGLLDYVAMDMKNALEKYPLTVGTDSVNIQEIEESIDFLLLGTIPYEFRTTVVKELHSVSDIAAIGQRIRGAEKYFLQNFSDRGSLIASGFSSHDEKTLLQMRAVAQETTKFCKIR